MYLRESIVMVMIDSVISCITSGAFANVCRKDHEELQCVHYVAISGE